MIEEMRSALTALFPLKIKEATFTDPTLTIAGEGWAFSSPSAWRITAGGVLVFGWSDAAAADRIWDLCGQSIISVTSQSPRMAGDPAFELSSGQWLEIFSDHPTDPWSLSLPSMTFVGSPSDPAHVA